MLYFEPCPAHRPSNTFFVDNMYNSLLPGGFVRRASALSEPFSSLMLVEVDLQIKPFCSNSYLPHPCILLPMPPLLAIMPFIPFFPFIPFCGCCCICPPPIIT